MPSLRLVIRTACLMTGLVLILSAGQRLWAQDYREVGRSSIHNYTPKEYGASEQNWAIVQDHQGILHVGNTEGILAYDGVSWRTTALANRSTVRSLAVDARGTVYAGGQGDFGYLASGANGQYRWVSLLEHVPAEDRDVADVWQTLALPEGIYFAASDRLFRWDGRAIRTWKAGTSFDRAFAAWDTFYVFQDGIGLMRLQADSLVTIPGTERLADEWVYTLLPWGTDDLLLGTRRQGFFRLDETGLISFETDVDTLLADAHPYHAARLPDGTLALGTIRRGVVHLSADGRLLRVLDKTTGLLDDMVLYTYVDQEGGLWLGLNYGLVRVEVSSPLSFFDEETGLRGGVTDLARHNGLLYAATSVGLYKLQPGRSGAFPVWTPITAFETAQTWALLDAGSTLLAGTNEGVHVIQNDRITPLDDQRTFALHRARHAPDLVFAGRKNGLARFRFDAPRRAWAPAVPVEGVSGDVRAIAEGKAGELWLALQPTGVVRVRFTEDYADLLSVQRFGEAQGLPVGRTHPARLAERVVFVAETGRLYRFVPADTTFVPDTTLGAAFADGTQPVLLLRGDASGTAWLHTQDEKGNVLLQIEENEHRVHTPTRHLEAAVPSVLYVEKQRSGTVVWLEVDQKIVRYDAGLSLRSASSYPALIRRVHAGDSLLFGGDAAGNVRPPTLAHAGNAFRFNYAAPTFTAPERTHYQYLLDGFDHTWSDWMTKTEKEYTNLPEGDYTLRVRVRNVYGYVSREAAFAFTILPPWYRTWWAYAWYLIGSLGLVFGFSTGYNRYRTRQLEARNRELEAVVTRRTEQLRQKNEENERLLLNILPGSIAQRLKQGEETIADAFAEVTVLFSDLVGFTQLAQQLPAARLVAVLNELFSEFDQLALRHSIEKIKTIGDAYMAVAGLPEPRPDHAQAMAVMALEMIAVTKRFGAKHGVALHLRVGLNTGPVVAGVIGKHKFIYDLWGDAVNTASRMESHGVPDRVHVSATTFERVRRRFEMESRGEIEVKGKGRMQTYLIAEPTPDDIDPIPSSTLIAKTL